MYEHLAPCNYRECDNKNSCKRYSEEDIPNTIQFQHMFKNNECPYYIKIPTDIVNSGKD